jgi:hypothetical protein
MINAVIWIGDPYPFRLEERDAIQEALRRTYTHSIVYLREWPVDYVSIDNVTMTLCKQVAQTLKVIHRQWAIQDQANTGRIYCRDLETDIRGIGDGRPEWAKEKTNEG